MPIMVLDSNLTAPSIFPSFEEHVFVPNSSAAEGPQGRFDVEAEAHLDRYLRL
jgi:hypothetical protein